MSVRGLNAQGIPTSAVDGNSEGGRVNSVQSEPLLALYGAELVRTLWNLGEHGSMTVRPVQENGIWCIELTVTPDVESDLPVRWYGRRVIVREVPELAGTPYRPSQLDVSIPRPFVGPTQPAHPKPVVGEAGPAPAGEAPRNLPERKVERVGDAPAQEHRLLKAGFRLFARSGHHRVRVAPGHD